jgi:hypothetical protein
MGPSGPAVLLHSRTLTASPPVLGPEAQSGHIHGTGHDGRDIATIIGPTLTVGACRQAMTQHACRVSNTMVAETDMSPKSHTVMLSYKG